MNRRLGTSPSHGRDDPKRLAWWGALVAALITLQYASRYGSQGSGASEPLYRWSFLAGSIAQELFFLLVILAIAGFRLRAFALRRPRSLGEAAGLAIVVFVAVNVFEAVYVSVVQPGNEQGLTPTHWEPQHAAAYIANGIVICTLVPLVEELTFRGLGFSLLEPFGRWVAIVVTGLLFGLSHGLLLELPIIAAFGCLLGWLRWRTASIYPGVALHAAFNLFALVAAVTIGG